MPVTDRDDISTASARASCVWTIGHSTRTLDEFTTLLAEHAIALLADVRLLPGSRRYPHFNSETLSVGLRERGIRYEHFPELGGRRKPRPDSLNTAWRNDSFRGYADYMETPEFAGGIARLLGLAAATGPAAIMCAEAVWWRCHRALVSDYLKVRGTEVVHILGPNKTATHPFTSAAEVIDGRLSYAGPAELGLG